MSYYYYDEQKRVMEELNVPFLDVWIKALVSLQFQIQ